MPYTEEEAYANAKDIYRDLSENRSGIADATIRGIRNDAKMWAGYAQNNFPESPKIEYLYREIHDDTDYMLERMAEAGVETWTPKLEQATRGAALNHTAAMVRKIHEQGNLR